MNSDDIYTLFKESMEEVKELIKGVENKIDKNYKEFGETKLKVNTLETQLKDYDEIKREVKNNSRITWLLSGLLAISLTILQILGN